MWFLWRLAGLSVDRKRTHSSPDRFRRIVCWTTHACRSPGRLAHELEGEAGIWRDMRAEPGHADDGEAPMCYVWMGGGLCADGIDEAVPDCLCTVDGCLRVVWQQHQRQRSLRCLPLCLYFTLKSSPFALVVRRHHRWRNQPHPLRRITQPLRTAVRSVLLLAHLRPTAVLSELFENSPQFALCFCPTRTAPNPRPQALPHRPTCRLALALPLPADAPGQPEVAGGPHRSRQSEQ